MDNHRQHLKRGFNWLGGATAIAKAADFTTTLLALVFLTKEQVGIGAMVIATGMVVEALDGIGTADALVQARRVSRIQCDSIFWFAIAAAMTVGTLTLLAAPVIGHLYGSGALTLYFVAVAFKQPMVAAAVVPLSLLNRALRYERIAMVNLAGTLGGAITRLTLAVSGAGAWALVAGYTASGVCILAGAMLARPFLPRLRFRLSTIRPLLHFGVRSAASSLFDQTFRNIDFLLVGGFYGPSALAVYRVAFDAAMEPAMAVSQLLRRATLPVFARVAHDPHELTEALSWSLRRLLLLVAPLAVSLVLAAHPLLALLQDGNGQNYAEAALPLQLLAVAALLRVMLELLFPLMLATGKPDMAARLSATTLTLLSLGILVIGLTLPAKTGVIAAAGLWLAIYPFALLWAAAYLWREWRFPPAGLFSAAREPALGMAVLLLLVLAVESLAGGMPPGIEIGFIIAAMSATYACLFLHSSREEQRQAVKG